MLYLGAAGPAHVRPPMAIPPRPTRRRDVAAAAALLIALHAALAWWYHVPALTVGHDDAVYVLLGRSLRALEYRDLYRVGTPPHAVYPPGYPALLALVGATLGERLQAFYAVQALVSAAGLLAAFAAVRRLWSDTAALAVLALLAVNPILVRSASVLGTDTPLATLVAVALWATVRRARPAPPGAPPVASDDAATDRVGMAIAGGAAIAALLTRTAGIALPAAIVLCWLGGRHRKSALLLAAATAAFAAAWVARVLTAPSEGAVTYARDYVRAGHPIGSESPSLVARVVEAAHYAAGTAWGYLTSDVPTALALPMRGGVVLDNAGWAIVLATCGLAGAWWLWRRWRAAAWFVAGYVAILLVWPWNLPRFVIPAVPIAVPLLLAGAAVVGARVAGRRGARLAPAGLWVVMMAGAVWGTAAALRERLACDPGGATRSDVCWRSDRGDFAAAMATVAREAPPDAPVVVRRGATVHFHTGHRTLPHASLADSAWVDAALAGHPDLHVILGGVGVAHATVAEQLGARCDRFRVVRRVSDDTFVLRATRPGERGDACAAR